LRGRFSARSVDAGIDAAELEPPVLSAGRLDAGQAAVVAALAGDRSLLVVEGAAGAGKTTTLAATRALLEDAGRRLVVVTPTLKAAKVAASEVGSAAGSAAWLAFQHGWRWDQDGAWTRLQVGEADPVTGRAYAGPNAGAQLRPGDLLVVDEAGMLDQDTARALLSVADECRVRVALLGDRHQLAAVGRGGVLDLAAAEVDPTAHLTLDTVHRFTRTLPNPDASVRTVPDITYADLTLAMRTGEDPGGVFDALATSGRIRLHPDAATLHEALATTAALSFDAGEQVAVVVDTREQAAQLNTVIRDRLVAADRVDDVDAVTTWSGQRIGAGDRIATRRNDRDLGVANRDVWVVGVVGQLGELIVTPANTAPADVTPAAGRPAGGGSSAVTPGSAGLRVLPPDYVTEHAELAYASTAHGVQGDTVPTAHLVIGEHTGAASAYVGMTRGRETNTAHLVAADLAEAREQWIAVFARDRTDLGPAHAGELAAAEGARYAAARPLEEVLADLREAWTTEQHYLERLEIAEPERDELRQIIALHAEHAVQLATVDADYRKAAVVADRIQGEADALGAVVAAEGDRMRGTLLAAWDAERGAAQAAAAVVLAGPGRLGFRRGALARSTDRLTAWADRWRPHLPELPTDPGGLARLADRADHRPTLRAALDASARRAAAAHPDLPALRVAAQAAFQEREQAGRALTSIRREQEAQCARLGSLAFLHYPDARLADTERYIATSHQGLADSRARIATLTAEPALRSQPPDRLDRERRAWRDRRDAARTAHRGDPPPDSGTDWGGRLPRPEDLRHRGHQRGHGRGVSR
jgi:exodeoxyribonuclease V alpha subunit